MLSDEALVEGNVGGLDGQLAPHAHGIAGIDGEVDQDLLELTGIDLGQPEVLVGDRRQLDVGAE